MAAVRSRAPRSRRRSMVRRSRYRRSVAVRPRQRRRRFVRSRAPGRRRILDVTSVKKQDNMLTWVPDSATNPAGSGAPSSITLPASGGIIVLPFCPTARDYTEDEHGAPDRNSQNVFMRGYKETCSLRVSGGSPWRRRRIVFRSKGSPTQWLQVTSNLFTPDFYRHQSSTGYHRLANPLVSLPMVQAITTPLFKGVENVDWRDYFIAKVDPDRYTVMSSPSSSSL